MSFNFILLFSMTVFVASIIPGPSMLLALTHGIQYGAKRTIASAVGNVTVTLIQASISPGLVETIFSIKSINFSFLFPWMFNLLPVIIEFEIWTVLIVVTDFTVFNTHPTVIF